METSADPTVAELWEDAADCVRLHLYLGLVTAAAFTCKEISGDLFYLGVMI